MPFIYVRRILLFAHCTVQLSRGHPAAAQARFCLTREFRSVLNVTVATWRLFYRHCAARMHRIPDFESVAPTIW